MSTAVFDGSTPDHRDGYPTAPDAEPTAQPIPEFDALEMLREQTTQRDQTTERTAPVPIPGTGWRLVCATDFEFRKYRRWQESCTPPRKVNQMPDFLAIDQAKLSVLILMHTCEGLEYLTSDGQWRLLTDPEGRARALTDSALLSTYNSVDPRDLLRKLFGGRDAALIKAGNVVIEAAGYGGDDEAGPAGDDNPLD